METYRQLVLILWVLLVLALLGATLWFALVLHGDPLVTASGFLCAGGAVFVTRELQKGRHGGPVPRAAAVLLCIALAGYVFPIARDMAASGVEATASREFLKFCLSALATAAASLGILLFTIDAMGDRIAKGW